MQELHDLLSVMKDIHIMATVTPRRMRRIAKVSGRTLAMLGNARAAYLLAVTSACPPCHVLAQQPFMV